MFDLSTIFATIATAISGLFAGQIVELITTFLGGLFG